MEDNRQASYCKKCGDVVFTERTICRICGSKYYECDNSYDMKYGVFIRETPRYNENEAKFIEEVIKPNPEFNAELYANKNEILKQKRDADMAEYLRQTRRPDNIHQPKCPTCGSANVKKISVGAKAVGAGLFGLFSRTARSQFECKNCGYKW